MRGKKRSCLLALGGMKYILTWPQVILNKSHKWESSDSPVCSNKQEFAQLALSLVSLLCLEVAFKVEQPVAVFQKINLAGLEEGHYANQAW